MIDFGLLVGRFSTSTPSVSTNDTLRELRIDGGGRLFSRLADDRDVSIRYFEDGESVDGTPANDRGIVILGKNDTDSNYQMFRLADDGSLIVSFQGGADASEAADKGLSNDGEVALVVNTWVLLQEKAVSSGKIHVDGWSFASDKNTIFQIALVDDTGADGVERTDITELLDSQVTTSARPSDHASFNRALSRAGGTNIKIAIFAKQIQAGANGVGLSMINAHTTT